MELDEFGIPLCSHLSITVLVELLHVWDRLIKMDGVTQAIVMGKLCYLRCVGVSPPLPVMVGTEGSFQPAPGQYGLQSRFVFSWRRHVGC